jgi:hypothetical protein
MSKIGLLNKKLNIRVVNGTKTHVSLAIIQSSQRKESIK